jgi:hypothetical protein
MTDLSSAPPVPPEAYDLLRALIKSGQVPERRMAELLRDEAFSAWMAARDAPPSKPKSETA